MHLRDIRGDLPERARPGRLHPEPRPGSRRATGPPRAGRAPAPGSLRLPRPWKRSGRRPARRGRDRARAGDRTVGRRAAGRDGPRGAGEPPGAPREPRRRPRAVHAGPGDDGRRGTGARDRGSDGDVGSAGRRRAGGRGPAHPHHADGRPRGVALPPGEQRGLLAVDGNARGAARRLSRGADRGPPGGRRARRRAGRDPAPYRPRPWRPRWRCAGPGTGGATDRRRETSARSRSTGCASFPLASRLEGSGEAHFRASTQRADGVRHRGDRPPRRLARRRPFRVGPPRRRRDGPRPDGGARVPRDGALGHGSRPSRGGPDRQRAGPTRAGQSGSHRGAARARGARASARARLGTRGGRGSPVAAGRDADDGVDHAGRARRGGRALDDSLAGSHPVGPRAAHGGPVPGRGPAGDDHGVRRHGSRRKRRPHRDRAGAGAAAAAVRPGHAGRGAGRGAADQGRVGGRVDPRPLAGGNAVPGRPRAVRRADRRSVAGSPPRPQRWRVPWAGITSPARRSSPPT